MKAETLQKLIDSKLTLKDGKTIAKNYREVINFIVYNKTSRPYYYSGKGRFSTCAGVDYIGTALRILGIDFETANDAPRGGHSGYFVRLTKKGIRQTKSFRDEKLQLYAEIYKVNEAKKIEIENLALTRRNEIVSLILGDMRFSDFINRKISEGNSNRTIAWKLSSGLRVPNLAGYSISEILTVINLAI